MVTDQGPIKMLSEMGIRLNENTNFSPEDMGFLNRDQELNFIRSGSCPPTVEGSLKANNAFLNDEDFRSDPDYSSYYFGRGNVNPRLPPPNMSKEDWRSVGSSKVGGIGDNRKVGGGNSNLAPGVNLQNLKREEKMEWVDEGDGLIGLSLGRQKSFAEIFQEDLGHSNTIVGKPSHPSSRNAFNDTSETDLALHRELISGDNLRHSSISSSQTFASVLGASLSRNNTPDPILVARTPSPGLPPVGVRMNKSEKENNNSYNSFSSTTPNDLIGGLSGMSLSNNSLNRRVDEDIITQAKLQKDMIENHNFLFEMQQRKNNVIKTSQPTRNSINNSNTYPDLDRSFASLVGSPGANSPSNYYTTTNNYGLGGYSLDPVSPSFGQNFSKFGNHTTIDPLQMPQVDSLYAQYFTNNINEPMAMNNSSYLDLLALQKQYMETLLPSQKQYGMPYMNNSNALNPGYYGNPSLNVGMNYLGSPLTSPVFSGSPGGPGSPLRLDERSMRFQSGVRNLEGIMGSWHSNGNITMSDGFGSSLLDEFKTNKVKNYELSDILGHVVEFSADQYGSRFIQQKLETATTEEKNLVYDEIRPHAYALMTDVFGNYVIQKFFEHGSSAQRRELAEQLIGHVLALSLQMYGCRVIQKAIEVVELDQQTKMVAELDGHVMRCVRDQNGNHVIQKCIECVPQDVIHFIVSTFYGQVVTLSTHPYGCRVIQRVLENCDNPQTQQIMMDEIMPSICMLAQDQYGNYVVQHVLEHGKPEERSSIIKKLAGQIVQMSQQKYASNVVEKCLAFGGPEERQYLVNEILGTTDENEPLQAMMKDQFANYVVQKVLETCDDRQREYILSRIKVHLNALKKYTYGKHIVARVEKLVAAGERRIGLQSNQ